ncbi:MAG: phosphatidate cytidylyltransferase [Candidatus Omnitrophica bacterium]|nr:phosphatidate cytidylyltransferase [Candidatus Omnitrophota bacterium]
MRIAKRTATAVTMIAAVIGGIFFLPAWFFSAAVTGIIGIGLFEFYSLIEKKGIVIYKYFGVWIGLLIPLSIALHFEPTKGWELFTITAATLGFFILQFVRKDSSQAILGISTTLFGIFYVSWFFSYLIKIRFLPAGVFLVGFLLLVTKMGDIGAYVVGSRFGRHSLIVRISPRKTVEGAAGGLLFSVAAAAASRLYVPWIPLTHLIGLGILLGSIAQVGDLCESLIKRDCGVKDSGVYLPGLGGVLDVIDSVIFNAPIFYFYLLHFQLDR